MNSTNPLVLIMAGGSGTRLWPYSRQSKPKQLLKIFSDKTLIEETIDRALQITTLENIFIGTNQHFKQQMLTQSSALKDENFIIEPLAKNTAPIIAYFVATMLKRNFAPQTAVIVLSADHFIEPAMAWVKHLRDILEHSNDFLWCLGVKPTRPDTGYGYIQAGTSLSAEKSLFRIAAFQEKPDTLTAEKYLAQGNYSWNSGMFVFSLGLFKEQIEMTATEIYALAYQAAENPAKVEEYFEQMPNISVDYAVLEKSSKMAVCFADFVWDDVGSFGALKRVLKAQKNNYVTYNSKAFFHDSNNNIVHSSSLKVALLGVEDLVVVEHDGILLVARQDRLDDIKKMRETCGEENF